MTRLNHWALPSKRASCIGVRANVESDMAMNMHAMIKLKNETAAGDKRVPSEKSRPRQQPVSCASTSFAGWR